MKTNLDFPHVRKPLNGRSRSAEARGKRAVFLWPSDALFVLAMLLGIGLLRTLLTSSERPLHLPWTLMGLVFLGHWLWIRALPLERPYRILATALMTSTQMVVSQIVLGVFDHLTAAALAWTNLAIVAGLLASYGLFARAH